MCTCFKDIRKSIAVGKERPQKIDCCVCVREREREREGRVLLKIPRGDIDGVGEVK